MLAGEAHASARQLHGGPLLGGSWSSGGDGGGAGSLGALGAYDFTDLVRLYAVGTYHLGATNARGQLMHRGDFAVGVALAVDVVTFVPWIGLGPQLSVLGSASWFGVVPGVELRAGLDWLPTRFVGMQLTVAGAPSFLPDAWSNHSGMLLSAAVGVRFTTDL